jgi:hypothetical protein
MTDLETRKRDVVALYEMMFNDGEPVKMSVRTTLAFRFLQ